MTLTRSDGDRHQFAIADRGLYTSVTGKMAAPGTDRKEGHAEA